MRVQRIDSDNIGLHTEGEMGGFYVRVFGPVPKGYVEKGHRHYIDHILNLTDGNGGTAGFRLWDLANIGDGPNPGQFSGSFGSWNSGNCTRWEKYPTSAGVDQAGDSGCWYTMKNGSATLLKLKPPAGDPIAGTWTVTTVTGHGLTAPTNYGDGGRHYSRFFYIPALQCFGWIPNMTSPVELWKP